MEVDRTIGINREVGLASRLGWLVHPIKVEMSVRDAE
jgi:hypothetical protein